jgi:mannose-6-phosphate isomerase-like protein (cupin superfamily)
MQSGVSTTRLESTGDDRFQRVRAELGVESFGMNLIRLAPGQRGRIHAHKRQEEVYVVLEGTLTLELGPDEALDLGPHEVARVAPEVRRRVVNRGEGPALVLALGGATPHEARDGLAWGEWDEDGPGRSPQDVPLPGDLSLGPG